MSGSMPHPSFPGISTFSAVLLTAGAAGLLVVAGSRLGGSFDGVVRSSPSRQAFVVEVPARPEPSPLHDIKERIRDWDRRQAGMQEAYVEKRYGDRIRLGLALFAELEVYLSEASRRDSLALERIPLRSRRELSRVAYQTGDWAAGGLGSQGRWAEAAPVYERLLDVDRQLFGEESDHKGFLLQSLGMAHLRMGDRERGLAYYRRLREHQRKRREPLPRR